MVAFNALVGFEKRGTDANGDELAGEFEPVFECRASVDYLRGTESAMTARLEGRQPANITVRDAPQTREITGSWRAVILAGFQVRVGDEFNITAAAPARERGYITVVGVTGGATG